MDKDLLEQLFPANQEALYLDDEAFQPDVEEEISEEHNTEFPDSLLPSNPNHLTLAKVPGPKHPSPLEILLRKKDQELYRSEFHYKRRITEQDIYDNEHNIPPQKRRRLNNNKSHAIRPKPQPYNKNNNNNNKIIEEEKHSIKNVLIANNEMDESEFGTTLEKELGPSEPVVYSVNNLMVGSGRDRKERLFSDQVIYNKEGGVLKPDPRWKGVMTRRAPGESFRPIPPRPTGTFPHPSQRLTTAQRQALNVRAPHPRTLPSGLDVLEQQVRRPRVAAVPNYNVANAQVVAAQMNADFARQRQLEEQQRNQAPPPPIPTIMRNPPEYVDISSQPEEEIELQEESPALQIPGREFVIPEVEEVLPQIPTTTSYSIPTSNKRKLSEPPTTKPKELILEQEKYNKEQYKVEEDKEKLNTQIAIAAEKEGIPSMFVLKPSMQKLEEKPKREQVLQKAKQQLNIRIRRRQQIRQKQRQKLKRMLEREKEFEPLEPLTQEQYNDLIVKEMLERDKDLEPLEPLTLQQYNDLIVKEMLENQMEEELVPLETMEVEGQELVPMDKDELRHTFNKHKVAAPKTSYTTQELKDTLNRLNEAFENNIGESMLRINSYNIGSIQDFDHYMHACYDFMILVLDWCDEFLTFLERYNRSYNVILQFMSKVPNFIPWLDRIDNQIGKIFDTVDQVQYDYRDRVLELLEIAMTEYQYFRKAIIKKKKVGPAPITEEETYAKKQRELEKEKEEKKAEEMRRIRQFEIDHNINWKQKYWKDELLPDEKEQDEGNKFAGIYKLRTALLNRLKRDYATTMFSNVVQKLYSIVEKDDIILAMIGETGSIQRRHKVLSKISFRFESPMVLFDQPLTELLKSELVESNYTSLYRDFIYNLVKINEPTWQDWKWQLGVTLQIYKSDNETFVTKLNSAYTNDFFVSLNLLGDKLDILLGRYNIDNVDMINFYINIMSVRFATDQESKLGHLKTVNPESALIGAANSLGKQYQDFGKKWYIMSPNTKSNCLYNCIGVGRTFNRMKHKLNTKKLKELLAPSISQTEKGKKIKRLLERKPKSYASRDQIQDLCNILCQKIIIHNHLDEKQIFKPKGEEYKKEKANRSSKYRKGIIPIHLFYEYNHFCLLIRRKHLNQDIIHHLQSIDKSKVSTIKKAKIISPKESSDEDIKKRIMTYDLESYQEPKPNTQTNETIQVCYAIGWCFEIKHAEEEKMVEQYKEFHYQIVSYDWKRIQSDGTSYIYPCRILYGQLLGTDCLTKVLAHWMNTDIFRESVFYAHNGGKYDLRLILGQSDIFRNLDYKINALELIELNGRFLNMKVMNVKKKYEDDIYKDDDFHSIYFKDSIPIFGPDNSLDSLCKEFDVAHKKKKEDVHVHQLMNKDTWKNLWEQYNMNDYLMRDVLGLYEVLEETKKQCFEATGIHITSINTGASLAKTYFLKNKYQFKHPREAIYTLTKTQEDFIRDGYFGGRVENFVSKVCNEKIYYYDFTSLYPDVATLYLPTGSPHWLVDPSLAEHKDFTVRERHQGYITNIFEERVYFDREIKICPLAFWKIRIRTKSHLPHGPLKPLFGIKDKDITKNMLLFPWFDATEEKEKAHNEFLKDHAKRLFHADMNQLDVLKDYIYGTYEEEKDKAFYELVVYEKELKEWFRRGAQDAYPYEIEPINALFFEHAPILKEAMEGLFKMKSETKQKGQKALSKLWKIILNSLYGVWGLRKFDREGIEIALPEDSNWCSDLFNNKLESIQNHGNYIVTRRKKDLEVKNTNIALAAAITSEARLKLYRLICDIELKGGKVLYCDTDSIITNYCIEDDQVLNDKWIGPSNGKDLGSLKNEIDDCLKDHKDELTEEELIDQDYFKSTGIKRNRKYFDRAVIVAPKLYYVEACHGKIAKKAHKGYKEIKDSNHPDIVTFDRIAKLVDTNISEYDRVLKQTTIQFIGSNAGLVNETLPGVELRSVTKEIRCCINKGNLDKDGIVHPLNYPEEIDILQSERLIKYREFKRRKELEHTMMEVEEEGEPNIIPQEHVLQLEDLHESDLAESPMDEEKESEISDEMLTKK